MKKLTITSIVSVLLLITVAVWADYKPVVLGDEEIVVSGATVYALNAVACPGGTITSYTSGTTDVVSALITVRGDAISWKDNVTYSGVTKTASNAPTGTSGGILSSGDYLKLGSKYEIDGFGMIIDTSGSGSTVYVIYYGPND